MNFKFLLLIFWLAVIGVGFRMVQVARADFFLNPVDQKCDLQSGTFTCTAAASYATGNNRPPNAAHFALNLRLNFGKTDIEKMVLTGFSADDGIQFYIADGATGKLTASNIFGSGSYNQFCTGNSPNFPNLSPAVDFTQYLTSKTNIITLWFNDCHGGVVGGQAKFSITGQSAPTAFTLTATPNCSAVNLSWPAATGASYTVKRDGASIAGPITQTSYQDTSVKPGELHRYLVSATNKIGSANSNDVTSARQICADRLTITPSSATVPSGVSQQFSAQLILNTGETKTVTADSQTTWTATGQTSGGECSGGGKLEPLTCNPVVTQEIGIITPEGLLTATTLGATDPPRTGTVTATHRFSDSQTVSATATVTVTAASPSPTVTSPSPVPTVTVTVTAPAPPLADGDATNQNRFQGLWVGNAIEIRRGSLLIEYDDRTTLVPPPGFADVRLPTVREAF